ncbi:hypothetical protein HRbin40_01175 [bacterium HR40]|nr:hypothetical protein HRbin40_01175 [bacterium HR40]
MEELERAAEISVARGVGFAALAILVLMLAFIFEPALSLLVGAAGALLVASVLELKARLAPSRCYRNTEAWLMLESRPAWSGDVAQRLVSTVLAATLRRYARIALRVAVAFWAASVLLRLSAP